MWYNIPISGQEFCAIHTFKFHHQTSPRPQASPTPRFMAQYPHVRFTDLCSSPSHPSIMYWAIWLVTADVSAHLIGQMGNAGSGAWREKDGNGWVVYVSQPLCSFLVFNHFLHIYCSLVFRCGFSTYMTLKMAKCTPPKFYFLSSV